MVACSAHPTLEDTGDCIGPDDHALANNLGGLLAPLGGDPAIGKTTPH
jgi:hypothetical protein